MQNPFLDKKRILEVVPSEFKMIVTSPTTPVFNGIGGVVTVLDNLDGTFDITAPESVTNVEDNAVLSDITEVLAVSIGGVTNMSNMFYNWRQLTNIDVSAFNTSKVTNMYSLFANCINAVIIDLSNFDTGNVINMERMFSSCSKATSIDVSNFDTGKVNTMEDMFYLCGKLISVDVSSFNTSVVTNMHYMFLNCADLTFLDLSSFDFSMADDMGSMFSGCSLLTCITNINTTNATDKTFMFASTPSLIQPDGAAQTDIIDANGADWTNASPCP